ncbi:hypothetical protein ACWGR4_35100 [Embleya sp. NPDC055664]|uniref:hypothetical protein n=1 Tax=Embleya sp. NPDC059237 TaxID=3346784 RepID=UPI00367649EB
MTQRMASLAVPLRPVIRLLAGAVLACAALLGSAFPVHAESLPSTATIPTVCPFHHTAHEQRDAGGPHDKGDGSGRCGDRSHACVPATVPPLPPVVAPAPCSMLPPWLADPDAVGIAPAPTPAKDAPDLTVLCVSRT